jgi:hypothetical protein
VALTCTLVHDLAGAGQTERLLSSAMGFHLWHFIPPGYLSLLLLELLKKIIERLLEFLKRELELGLRVLPLARTS